MTTSRSIRARPARLFSGPSSISAACASLVCLCFFAAPARAQCPPGPGGGDPGPPNSTIPCGIVLVGTTAGVADPRGEFYVVHRDLANNPVVGCEIEVHFGTCAPDIRIAENQTFPGVTVECLTNDTIVRATTDVNGIAHFRIIGGALASAPGVGAGYECGQIYAGGVFLGRVNVGAFDLNVAGGINPVDISLWLADAFQPNFVGRSDYNCTQTINPADLAMLFGASFAGGSTQSATSYCH